MMIAQLYQQSRDVCSVPAETLAGLLKVDPGELQDATDNDRPVKGFDVADWAVRLIEGRLFAYWVPLDIYSYLIDEP
jgi:hypothetical protein